MDLQSQYFSKAEVAYREKEYKLCLILLRKVSLNEYRNVSLLVDCSYDYWKETIISLADSKAVSRVTSRPGSAAVNKHVNLQSITQLMSAVERTSVEFETVLKAIKESFTNLLANVKAVPIKQYDYIRLTHVYLAEGANAGALQIMQLASARGFLEDPLIVLQSWSIMKRISSEKDTVGAMSFLVSTLVIEASQRKRNSHSRQGGRTHKQDRLKSAANTTASITKAAATGSTTMMTFGQSAKSFASTALSVKSTNGYSPLPEPDPARTAVFVSESDFPTEYLYLLCAAFVHREALKKKNVPKEYKRLLGELAAVLSEAYFLTVGIINEDVPSLNAWFNNPLLWRGMAEKLDIHTPYVLLAQECYWEAFVRSPLEEYHIVAYISSLIRNKTKSEVPALLARAMEVNPWNLFVRNALYELDCELVEDPAERQWAELFLQDDHCAVAVQSSVRGWRLRQHWPELHQRFLLRKKFYSDRKAKALMKGLLIWQGHLKVCLRSWRVYIEDWKQLKFVSACLIQAHARGKMWRVWYAWTQQKIAYANGLYFVVYSKMRDKRRVDRFQHWYAMHMQLVRRRSADLLANVLFMNGYSRLLRNGMDFILTVMRVKRKHTYKRMLAFWNQKMHAKRLRRARTTIRFFVRGVFERKLLAAKEEQLAQVMQTIADKTNGPDFRKNNLPLMRAKWDHWFMLYQRIVFAQTIMRLSSMLARSFFRKRGRAIRRGLRARVEGQRAFLRSHWYHTVFRIFSPWRLNAGALKIQRAARVRQARKIYKRLVGIAQGVEEMLETKRQSVCARILWRWEKHNFLQRREKIRASYWIVKLFRLIVVRGRIRRKCAGKVSMGNYIDTLHRCHLRLSLRRLKAATIYASRYIIVSKMVDSLRKGALRGGFYIWARFISAQRAADRLLYCRVVRALEKKFWVGACVGVAIKALEAPSMEGTDGEWVRGQVCCAGDSFYLTNSEYEREEEFSKASFVSQSQKLRSTDTPRQLESLLRSCKPQETSYKSFETVVPSQRVVLYDSVSLEAARAFKAWTACFRLRQRYLRGISDQLSALLVRGAIRTALTRTSAAFIIQNRYRCFVARRRFIALLSLRRRQHEVCAVLAHAFNGKLLTSTWAAMAEVRGRLAVAAVCIQCMVRARLARKECAITKDRHQGLQTRSNQVHLKYVKKIYSTYLHRFQLNYCRSVHKMLLSSHNAEFSRSQKALPVSARMSRNQARSAASSEQADASLIRESRSAQFGSSNRAALGLTNEFSQTTDGLSLRPAVLPDVFERLTRMNKALAVNPNKRSKNLDGKQSFVSEECRQHLLRLHQTGVFIFDSSGGPVNVLIDPKTSTFKKMLAMQAEEQLHPQLTNEELEFCLQNANAVFCQHTRKSALRCVLANFSGVKLVLRGGELAANTVATLMYHFLRQPAQNTTLPANITNSDSESDLLILHFVAVNMGVSARLALVRSLVDAKIAGADSDRCRVCELAVDTDTLGMLGAAVLLRALQNNAHLRILSVQCSGDSKEGEGYLDCFGESLLLLSENPFIQELKFFGAVLTLPLLENLLSGVQTGYKSLRILEFPIDLSSGFTAAPAVAVRVAPQPRHGKLFRKGYSGQAATTEARVTCATVAEGIVEAAKARAYSGRVGLSVTVNYR